MVDFYYGVKLYVGARVYHQDEVSESFGTVTEVTDTGFSVLWDNEPEADSFLPSFASFLEIQP